MSDLIALVEAANSTNPLILALCVALILSLAVLRKGK